MKDILDARLCRREDGGGFISFPRDIPSSYLAELRAETKVGEQWTRDSHVANETWDLYIYAYTAIVRFGGNDASLAWVPDWARPPRDAPKALRKAEAAGEEAALDPAQRSTTRVPPRPIRRRGVRTVRAR
jgi:phage terminase large subunit GpA-like protein